MEPIGKADVMAAVQAMVAGEPHLLFNAIAGTCDTSLTLLQH
jgi:hypothetical protein